MVTTASSAEQPSSSSMPDNPTQNPNSHSNSNHQRSTTTNTLHNFSSLPCFNIKWGCRKQLRCVKQVSDQRSDDNNDNDNDNDDGGILAMKEKLMLDFRNQVQQIQADFIHHTSIPSSSAIDDNHNNNNVNNGVEKRPWNLRTRRAVCKHPNGKQPTFSPVKFTESKSPLKFNGGGNGGCEVLPATRRRRKKFSGSLSRQEIDEDFVAMGTWPAKRPKRRPKLVQRQIDGVFPGYWLSEITADMYKVNEQPQP